MFKQVRKLVHEDLHWHWFGFCQSCNINVYRYESWRTLVCRWSAAVAACLTYSANVNINLFTAITPPKYGSNAVTGEAGAFLSQSHIYIFARKQYELVESVLHQILYTNQNWGSNFSPSLLLTKLSELLRLIIFYFNHKLQIIKFQVLKSKGPLMNSLKHIENITIPTYVLFPIFYCSLFNFCFFLFSVKIQLFVPNVLNYTNNILQRNDFWLVPVFSDVRQQCNV